MTDRQYSTGEPPQVPSEDVPPSPNASWAPFRRAEGIFESALDQSEADARAVADAIGKITAQWVGFYGRLILLEGGTVALSLTYLSALGQHAKGPVDLTWLRAGWWAVLASILSALMTELALQNASTWFQATPIVHARARQFRTFSRMTSELAKFFEGHATTLPGSETSYSEVFAKISTHLYKSGTHPELDSKKHVNSATLADRFARGFGAASILLAVVGFLALGIFAFKSAPILLP